MGKMGRNELRKVTAHYLNGIAIAVTGTGGIGVNHATTVTLEEPSEVKVRDLAPSHFIDFDIVERLQETGDAFLGT